MHRDILAAVVLALVAPAAFAADDIGGDAAAGEKVFRKCKACHAIGAGAQNMAGPMLNGVLDRAIASVDGFSYSEALNTLGQDGKTWTPDNLSAFLEKPKAYAEGTNMAFVGLRKEEDRANLIAYLASFPAEGS